MARAAILLIYDAKLAPYTVTSRYSPLARKPSELIVESRVSC